MLVAFLSASQDIVIDAYRVELLAADEQGAGAAATQIGYRIGMIASSAGALYLSAFGWTTAYGDGGLPAGRHRHGADDPRAAERAARREATGFARR